MGLIWLVYVVFTYVPATEYTDGKPLNLADIDLTTVYCGDFKKSERGADGVIGINLPAGEYQCFGTHTVDGVESEPSNTVLKVVPVASLAPTNFLAKE